MRLRQKIFLILLGLFSVIILLEIGLYFSGKFYYLYRLDNNRAVIDKKGVIRILCLGDSFTFGEGAPKGYSYPEQLQKIFDRTPTKKVEVYNAGIPGSNSSQLFKNLDSNIKRYNPNIIVILTGCNNNSNLMQSNYFLFTKRPIKSYLYRLDSILSQMRIYKIFKRSIGSFYKKSYKMDSFADNKIENKKHVSKELEEESKKHVELAKLYDKKREVKNAINEAIKALELDPFSDNAYYILGFIYLHRVSKPEAKKIAIEALRKAIDINFYNTPVHRCLFDAYSRTGQKEKAVRELEIMHNIDSNDEFTLQLLNYGLPNFDDVAIFKKTLIYDMQNVIRLTKAKKIRLILQNYVLNWPNHTLNWPNYTSKEIAISNKLPFVNNASVFKKLEPYKREYYFAEDGHCNANGYKIMAKNVYKVLIKEMRSVLN